MPDADNLNIRTEQREGAVIVAPEGDIDLARSPILRESLRGVQAKRPARLIIDLSRVEYMDSSGVATVVEALQIAKRNSTKLVLCGLGDRVRSIFEIARLDSVFRIVPTVEAALAS